VWAWVRRWWTLGDEPPDNAYQPKLHFYVNNMAASPMHQFSLIAACEAAFWVVLAIAMTLRYVSGRAHASRAFLLLLPAIDLLLLVLTTVDLKAGTRATFAHGLAMAYLGFTLAFGPLVVRWADCWFAYRFANGPRPKRAASSGWPAVKGDLKLWLRCVLAWAITLLMLGVLIAYVGNDAVTRPLLLWYRIAIGSIRIWFVLGPLWSLLFLSWKRSSDA
jgi:hypothetical protein